MLLVSDGWFVLNVFLYCIIVRYSAHLDNWSGFNFRYTHAILCTSEYWPNLWTRFNFLMWVTISLRRYQIFINTSDKSQFIWDCLKRKPICDIVFCVMSFWFRRFNYWVFCFVYNAAHFKRRTSRGRAKMENKRGKKDESISILIHPS